MRIQSRFCFAMLLFVGLICACGVREVQATLVSPSAWASIHDGAIDGFGDSFNGQSGLLGRAVAGVLPDATYQDRVIIEFDLGLLSGQVLTSAMLDFTVEALNMSSPALRAYDVFVYEGDGAASLADFAADGTYLDTIAYTVGAPMPFSIDILSSVTQLSGDGAAYLGVRIEPIGSRSPDTVIVSAPVLNIEAAGDPIPEPATVVVFALGGAITLMRRRRQ